MERVTHPTAHVDRCTQCRGLWFAMREHEHLKAEAARVDIGDAAVGERYDSVDRIDCPQCQHVPLLRMVDPVQPHIWFESCKFCYGRFYDAGEFRDFAEITLLETLLPRTKPERV